jgi:hypothetical protein
MCQIDQILGLPDAGMTLGMLQRSSFMKLRQRSNFSQTVLVPKAKKQQARHAGKLARRIVQWQVYAATGF